MKRPVGVQKHKFEISAAEMWKFTKGRKYENQSG